MQNRRGRLRGGHPEPGFPGVPRRRGGHSIVVARRRHGAAGRNHPSPSNQGLPGAGNGRDRQKCSRQHRQDGAPAPTLDQEAMQSVDERQLLEGPAHDRFGGPDGRHPSCVLYSEHY